MSNTMSVDQTPKLLDAIQHVLGDLRQAKLTLEKAEDTLNLASAFIAYAARENQRLVRERDAACGDSLSVPQF